MREIKGRLMEYLETCKIQKQDFSEKTGISLWNITGKGLESEFGGAHISTIIGKYTNLNPDWLLLGKGAMLRENNDNNEGIPQTGKEIPLKKETTLPLIPFEALAGFPAADNIGVAFADCEQYVVPEFIARGADCLVRVSGSSMSPKYSNGDILACRIVRDILFFQWGKVYVIDSSQGLLVKRIEPSDRDDCITLVSDNRDRYRPFDIPKSDIRSLAIVIGVIGVE